MWPHANCFDVGIVPLTEAAGPPVQLDADMMMIKRLISSYRAQQCAATRRLRTAAADRGCNYGLSSRKKMGSVGELINPHVPSIPTQPKYKHSHSQQTDGQILQKKLSLLKWRFVLTDFAQTILTTRGTTTDVFCF